MTGPNTPPRPGFTQAMTEERISAFPVVVGINHSSLSALALRRAADEAAHRSAHLHIVVGGDAQEAIDSSAMDDREMHTIASILRNRHVTIYPVDNATPETLLDYCKEVGASLLVVGCATDTEPEELENPATAHRLVDEAECDVLVVHADEQHKDH
jgi:K+-sensing histidine kinase KdpD